MILNETKPSPDLLAIEAVMTPAGKGALRDLHPEARLLLLLETFAYAAENDVEGDIAGHAFRLWERVRPLTYRDHSGTETRIDQAFRDVGRSAGVPDVQDLLAHVVAIGSLTEALEREASRCTRLVAKLKALPTRMKATAV